MTQLKNKTAYWTTSIVCCPGGKAQRATMISLYQTVNFLRTPYNSHTIYLYVPVLVDIRQLQQGIRFYTTLKKLQTDFILLYRASKSVSMFSMYWSAADVPPGCSSECYILLAPSKKLTGLQVTYDSSSRLLSYSTLILYWVELFDLKASLKTFEYFVQ